MCSTKDVETQLVITDRNPLQDIRFEVHVLRVLIHSSSWKSIDNIANQFQNVNKDEATGSMGTDYHGVCRSVDYVDMFV